MSFDIFNVRLECSYENCENVTVRLVDLDISVEHCTLNP